MIILYDFSFHESTQNSTPGRDVEKTGDIARAKEHWQGDLDSDSSSGAPRAKAPGSSTCFEGRNPPKHTPLRS